MLLLWNDFTHSSKNIREKFSGVEKLNSPDGGLMMVYGMYPGIPIENANALMNAFEKYCF